MSEVNDKLVCTCGNEKVAHRPVCICCMPMYMSLINIIKESVVRLDKMTNNKFNLNEVFVTYEQ